MSGNSLYQVWINHINSLIANAEWVNPNVRYETARETIDGLQQHAALHNDATLSGCIQDCRSFFSSTGSITLFNYTKMLRCLLGCIQSHAAAANMDETPESVPASLSQAVSTVSSITAPTRERPDEENPQDIEIKKSISKFLIDAADVSASILTKEYVKTIVQRLHKMLTGYRQQSFVSDQFNLVYDLTYPNPPTVKLWKQFCMGLNTELLRGRLSRMNSPFLGGPVGREWEASSPAKPYPSRIIDDPLQVSCELSGFLQQFADVTEHCVFKFSNATNDYDKSHIVELSKKFMSGQQKIIESMFTAFDKHRLRDTLYAGYRLYLLVYSCCCICHDRIARVIVDALMTDLISFQALTCRDTQELCQNLISVYKNTFTTRGANSVSQSTCRKAGESVIQFFRNWLNRHGVPLDESVVIYMKDRFEAKHTIAKLQDIIDGSSGMAEDDNDDNLLFKFMNENHHSVFDAVGNILKKYAVSIGKPTIDAARTNVVGAPFVVFESCSFQPVSSLILGKQYVSLTEIASIWNATDRILTTSEGKQIPSLNVGVAALVSLLPFDLTKVDHNVIDILNRIPNNVIFTPVMLHYRHSGLMNGVAEQDQNEFFHKAQSYFHHHKQQCSSEFRHLNLVRNFCTVEKTHLHSHVVIDGQPFTLVAVSRNALSNNVTGKNIDAVFPTVLTHGLRGQGCGDACGDIVFMGQGKKLRDKHGQPTPIGLVVAAISWWAKQFGDLSKEFLLLLIHILTGQKMGLFATPDWMAAKDFGIHGPTMVVAGNIIEVRALASSLKIDEDLQRAIAELQAKIEMYISKNGEDSLNQLLVITYNEDITLLKAKLNNLIRQQIETNQRNAVPGVIATCAFVDTLSDPIGLVVPKEQQKRYCESKLDRAIHRAVTVDTGTFFNLFQRPDVYPTLVSCVGNLQSALAVKRTWRIQSNYSEQLISTENLAEYIEFEISKEISLGKLNPRSPNMIQERYMQFIDEQLFGPFELFTQLENFETKYERKDHLSRSLRSNGSNPDFGSMDIPAKVRNKISKVLTEYVTKNTTSSRTNCLEFINKWIGGDVRESGLLGLDFDGISESASRSVAASDQMQDEVAVRTQCDVIVPESLELYSDSVGDNMGENSDTHNNSGDDMSTYHASAFQHAFDSVTSQNIRSYRDAVAMGAQTPPPVRIGTTQPSASAKGVNKLNPQNALHTQRRRDDSSSIGIGSNSRGNKNPKSTGQGKGRSGSGSTQNSKNYKKKEKKEKKGGSRKKNKHNTTKKYKTMSRKSRQNRRNKYKHIRTIKRRKSRRNNRN